MTDTVIGKLEDEPRSLAGWLLTRTEPRTACTMLCTTSRPTPRPETSVTCSLVEKPGRNRKSSSSASLSRAAIAAVVSPRSTTLARSRSRSMPRPSSPRDDLEHPRTVASLQPDCPHRRFAGRAALLGHFEAVIERVADQMVERRFQPVEDIAIDAGGLADDLEPRLLAQLAGQVADQAREAADAVGQRPHPAGQHFVVQPAGEVLAAASELLDRLDRLTQSLQAASGLALGLERSSRSAAGIATRRLDSRSSSRCSVPRSPVCRPSAARSESTNGRSRRVCTRDSPARPISRVKLSAVTRTTRSAGSTAAGPDRH